MINSDVSLQFLNLNLNRGEQGPVSFPDITVSTFILEPITGDLWVSNQTDGKILKCPQLNESCEEVVDTGKPCFSFLSQCIGKTANSRVFVVLKPAWEGRMTQL